MPSIFASRMMRKTEGFTSCVAEKSGGQQKRRSASHPVVGATVFALFWTGG